MAILPKIVCNFNENDATTIRDYSENGNDGTGSGITIAASPSTGNEATFNAATDQIDYGNITFLNGAAEMTLALNLTINTTTGDLFILNKTDVIVVNYNYTTGFITMQLFVNSGTATVTAALVVDTAYDVTFTYSSGSLKVYVDGTEIDEDTTETGVIAIADYDLLIGSSTSDGDSAFFKLNEIKLDDDEATQANINAWIAEPNGVYTDSSVDAGFTVGDVIGTNLGGNGEVLTGIVSWVDSDSAYRILPMSSGILGGQIFRRLAHLWDTTRQWALKIDDTPQICFYDGMSKSSEVFAPSKKTYCLNIDGVSTSNLKIIDRKESLPDAVSGVITLETPYNYYFTKEIDLLGDRLDTDGIVSILGGTPEISKITSTGLSAGTALLTSTYTIALNSIAINHATALNLDATTHSGSVIDWFGVNFEDSTTAIGTIKNYDNTIFNTIGFLNSGGLTFDGTIGTIAFTDTIFQNATGLTSIILPSTLTVSSRFRIDNCSFISLAGETSLNVSTSATISNEAYILDNVTFTGGGTYLTGVQSTDNKARFEGCRGVDNSGNIGQYYMQGNSTATTVSVSGTFYKVAGTTSSGAYVEKFDVTTTDNKAVYNGSLTGFYKVTVVASMVSGNNKVLALSIGKNGTNTTSSVTKSTSNGNNRSEAIMAQDVVQLSSTDYVEVFVANTSDTTNITVEDLNVIIERLN